MTNEIEELRKRIDRLEWLIGVMRDKETADALKGSLIDAQRQLEDLLKRRNGEGGSDAFSVHSHALRLARLAATSGGRRAPPQPSSAASSSAARARR